MLDTYVLHHESDRLQATRLLTGLLESAVVAEAGRSRQAARTAAGIIVCWSPKSVADADLVETAKRARAQGKLLQTKFKDCDVPAAFGEVDGVILEGWNGATADAGFLRLLNGVRILASGSKSKSKAPKGVGWRGTFTKRPLAWTLGAVTALAGGIGAASNLNTGKNWACSVGPIHGLCRRAGIIGPPPPSILSRVEGRWTPNTCSGDVFELVASDDGRELTLLYPGWRTTASVTGQSENSVTVDYELPEGGSETIRWERTGPNLRMSKPNAGGFVSVDYRPCRAG